MKNELKAIEKLMLKEGKAFSGFAVGDIKKAKNFYGRTLGLEVFWLED